MQQVERSSPFSRFVRKPRFGGIFYFLGTGAHRLGRVRRIAGMLVGVALAMLVVVGSLPAPAGAADVPRLGYVGRVAGTKAFVGVVVRGKRVMAYVCDGRKLARWFEGTLRDERARLRSGSGGRLTLKVGPRGGYEACCACPGASGFGSQHRRREAAPGCSATSGP